MAFEELVLSQPSTKQFLEHLQASAPADVLDLTLSTCYGDESKYVTIKFDPALYPRVELLMLTDVQFGHVLCQEARFIEFRDWVLAEPHRFVFFGGDMVDAAHSFSVGSPYDNRFEPQMQVFRFVEVAMPIRHRVLGYVGGNHERRTSKMFGDLGHLIATFLKVPYSSGQQRIEIFYGAHKPFTVALWHGTGGARTKGAKAQALHRFMTQQPEAQLCLTGHLHDAIILFDWILHGSKGKLSLKKKAGAMSSSFLEFVGTYAEVAGLSPSDTMMARTILEPNGHWEITAR